MSNTMTPEKAARILCVLQDVSPPENLDDHGHDDMRGYENFSEAIDAIRAMLNNIVWQRGGVRGAIIGSLAGGHLDAPDGGSYSKATLASIAEMMDLEIPEEIKKANGLH